MPCNYILCGIKSQASQRSILPDEPNNRIGMLLDSQFDKARVADMTAYRKLLGETLLTLPGVSNSTTYVVMEEVKEAQTLPL